MNSTPITNYNQINISNSEQTRVIAEIQAMVFLAKNDPRDENLVLEKVVKQCQRKSMAEVAMYSFPRGGQNVTGPSIRLAEVLGRAYGNIEFGVKILSQNENSVSALAYCWDLETNVRKTDYFEVRLEKYTKKDGNKKLTDPRDIYEHVASQGSRRVRGCILAMIPGDIVELAMDCCEKTLQSNTESLPERIQKLISAFTSYNITTQMLELRIGKNINAINNTELVSLRKIYQSIKDGMSNSSDYFDFTKHSQSKTTPIADIEGEVIFDKPQKTPEQIQQEIDDRNAKNLEEMNTTPLI